MKTQAGKKEPVAPKDPKDVVENQADGSGAAPEPHPKPTRDERKLQSDRS